MLSAAAFGAALLVSSAAPADEALVRRGAYLVNGILACGNCHTPKGPAGDLPGRELAGGLEFREEPFTAYAPNLTGDPETGIGNWSDEAIVAAIREGRRPDGSIVGPPMPVEFYRAMSDDDARAVVAYLRSIPAVRNAVPRSEYRMPLPASYGPPVGAVPAVMPADGLAYGAYLAAVGHCMECHTPFGPEPDRMARMGMGGAAFPGPWGTSIAANITSDPKTGIGRWTDAEVMRAITQGISVDGTPLKPPMAFHAYATMTQDDLRALVAWIRTVPPIENAIR
jgi:mono/diheme cytochrome c family protein